MWLHQWQVGEMSVTGEALQAEGFKSQWDVTERPWQTFEKRFATGKVFRDGQPDLQTWHCKISAVIQKLEGGSGSRETKTNEQAQYFFKTCLQFLMTGQI